MASRSNNVKCPVSERGMVAAFALARSRLAGHANAVHVAKARGEQVESVSETGCAPRGIAKRGVYVDVMPGKRYDDHGMLPNEHRTHDSMV